MFLNESVSSTLPILSILKDFLTPRAPNDAYMTFCLTFAVCTMNAHSLIEDQVVPY